MERSFKKEVDTLRLGAGEIFRGEGILAVTKALLQWGVSYVGGYQGAPSGCGTKAPSELFSGESNQRSQGFCKWPEATLGEKQRAAQARLAAKRLGGKRPPENPRAARAHATGPIA